ncbi:isocitrate lyase/PEP mutase family protein [Pseudooctadecabacter jejudonensis]|uniref:Methylisocitrate lyase n=1 Tax=Pseudooctadecabacter jejudonensis TaxID=1391910 RepID=A0A1Y5RIW7_9RHOB|nr:isocitrate lyase/phosphoenolpyruvate mutase family protein [Pseudooctadecabacter jejudonensis]SLN17243.1 Methylisocitrate lyase [Pseudooctadecabacter jejudonensis]
MTSFRDLHQPGNPFILANVWDAGSARMLAAMGAQALATSSAAHAFTLGRPDGLGVTRDEALAHAQDIVAATRLPVQGDFENGWGDDPDTVAETVRLAAEVGLAGICIEDIALPSPDAYDMDLATDRIRAAASAARALPRDFVLTARADGIMTGAYDIEQAIQRLQAFEAAGADCLYAPLPKSMADVARICSSVSAPVNVLVAGPTYTAQTRDAFARAGAARLSLGSAMARAAHRVIHDAAEAMLGRGDFSALGTSISGDTVDGLLRHGTPPP